MRLPQEIIRIKRDRGILPEDAIAEFVAGIASDRVSEGQIAAFAMAIFLNGMEPEEIVALTQAMTRSGTVLNWAAEGLSGPVLDKHSTGGVGDKTSLLLAPLIAACGGFVPMISGRGLGHTGGTLDKLDSIPGYVTQPDLSLFRKVVREAGAAIIGQTEDLAPADKRFYAVRDVTATVESIPLITASILSKKLAAGLDALVMDVKTGSGAFMATLDGSRALARSITRVGTGAGMATRALITDMNQILGPTAGNALEVAECMEILRDAQGDQRLLEVTMSLATEMLLAVGLVETADEAQSKLAKALASGAAADRFDAMSRALGGPGDIVERAGHYLDKAPVTKPVFPDKEGYIERVDTRSVGLAVVALGGGRTRADQKIDHRVGLSDILGLGEATGPKRPLAMVHAADEDAADRAIDAIKAAFHLSEEKVAAGPAVIETVQEGA